MTRKKTATVFHPGDKVLYKVGINKGMGEVVSLEGGVYAIRTRTGKTVNRKADSVTAPEAS